MSAAATEVAPGEASSGFSGLAIFVALACVVVGVVVQFLFRQKKEQPRDSEEAADTDSHGKRALI